LPIGAIGGRARWGGAGRDRRREVGQELLASVGQRYAAPLPLGIIVADLRERAPSVAMIEGVELGCDTTIADSARTEQQSAGAAAPSSRRSMRAFSFVVTLRIAALT
jgi:hypothetical protein